jgi:hypothetical protein
MEDIALVIVIVIVVFCLALYVGYFNGYGNGVKACADSIERTSGIEARIAMVEEIVAYKKKEIEELNGA